MVENGPLIDIKKIIIYVSPETILWYQMVQLILQAWNSQIFGSSLLVLVGRVHIHQYADVL